MGRIAPVIKLSSHHSASARLFLRVLLAAAIVVSILRFFSHANLGYDLTVQIQAAQNLIAGHGLKVYSARDITLGEPLGLHTLTHFPCAYSMYTAAGLSLGLPLAVVEKLYGLGCTLAGWWGWGLLALQFFGGGLERGQRLRWVFHLFAAGAPLFFTLPWNGTDIFLWAAIPWVCRELSAGATATGRLEVVHYLFIGLLCGACVMMRYASLVLAAYAAFVIFLHTSPRWSALGRRWMCYGLGLAPWLAAQAYFNFVAAEARVTPGGIDPERPANLILTGLGAGIKLLPTAHFLLFFWLPDRVLKITVQAGDQTLWSYVFTLLLFSLPLLAARKAGLRSVRAAFTDVRVTAGGLLVAVPLFLLTCTAMGEYPYISDYRYYRPCIPLVFLIAGFLATPAAGYVPVAPRWIALASTAFVAAFTSTLAVGTVFLFVSNAQGTVQRQKLMGECDLTTFPSIGLTANSTAAHDYIVQRMIADRRLCLVTNFDGWFNADASIDRSRIHPILRCEHFRGQRVQGPAHFLLALSDEDTRDGSIYYGHWDGKFYPAKCLEDLPDLRLVSKFPAEKIKILESVIPAGASVMLGAGENAGVQ